MTTVTASVDTAAVHLEPARRRFPDLRAPVSEADQLRQHSALMSPLIWDLAHVANYEEQWLLRAAAGQPAVQPDLDHIYDAFQHARASRSRLAILGPSATRTYAADIRGRVLEAL